MTEGDIDRVLSAVVTDGDKRRSLVAIRDRLAAEADDVTWEKHKAECRCVCGMGDGRTLVAILKELRTVIDAIDAMPNVDGQVSRLDRIAAGRDDEIAERRARRIAATADP